MPLGKGYECQYFIVLQLAPVPSYIKEILPDAKLENQDAIDL